MNWAIVAVLGAIGILVPIALVATFASTQDTHQYERHYGKNGFSPEPQKRLVERDELRDKVTADRAVASNSSVFQPVAEWPREL